MFQRNSEKILRSMIKIYFSNSLYFEITIELFFNVHKLLSNKSVPYLKRKVCFAIVQPNNIF